MKKLSPQEIEKDIQTASNKEFTPAGKVGIKRLKLSFCHALRKASEKTADTLSSDTAIVSAIGFGVLGFAALEKIVSGQSVSAGVLVPSAVAASLPFVADMAEKLNENLRKLEAKLIKDLRAQNIVNSTLMAKKGREF